MKLNRNIDSMRVGVVGGGSWGTALAFLLADKGYDIDLWVYEEEVRGQIETERENKVFLPGIPLSERIKPSGSLKDVVSGKDLILIVVPSHHMREIGGQMAEFVRDDAIVVTASKGIENKTHLTMTGVLAESLPDHPKELLAVLSGPSFAREVGNKVPTVVTAACSDHEVAKVIQALFSNSWFRVYTHEDPVGVEIGGAVKNVLAIAAGICDGMEQGLNSRAALITRGLTEMKRLGEALGADPHTFLGLSGVGDLMLTCTGSLSRNHQLGVQIGKGRTLDEILSDMRMVAEGVKTTRSVHNLSQRLGVELPICSEVYHILFDGIKPQDSVGRLMNRELKHEFE